MNMHYLVRESSLSENQKTSEKMGPRLKHTAFVERSRWVQICRWGYREKQVNERYNSFLFSLQFNVAKFKSTHITWQDGVKYAKDQNTGAEGLLLDVPKQGGAEPFVDVVHVKQAAEDLERQAQGWLPERWLSKGSWRFPLRRYT